MSYSICKACFTPPRRAEPAAGGYPAGAPGAAGGGRRFVFFPQPHITQAGAEYTARKCMHTMTCVCLFEEVDVGQVLE